MYHLRGAFSQQLVSKVSDVIESIGYAGDVAVCKDTRPSSASLCHTIISILLKNGNSVHNLGVGPTPYLSYYTKMHNCLGVMITASHNPEHDNGIKLFHSGKEADFRHNPPQTPSTEEYDCSSFRQAYMQDMVRKIDSEAVRRKSPKILIDFGNAASSNFTAHALRMIGARTVTLNADHSTPFSRSSEPEKGTDYLPNLISQLGVDFAIVHDIDSDRCRIATKDGLMNQDVQLLNMADYVCSSGDVFVTTVEASKLVVDELGKKGVDVRITPVGSNYVAEKVKSLNAVFGGEPCGEYVYADWLFSADGIYTALKFVEMYCKRGFTAPVPYNTIRDSIQLNGMDKKSIMECVRARVNSLGVEQINRMDGLLFTYKDAKVLVRMSNTQDIVRITVEHPNADAVKNVHMQIYELVRSCIKTQK